VASANGELARKAFKAFEQRDMDAIEELCTPDVEFDWSRRLIDPIVFHGYAGIQGFFEEMDGIFDEIAFEIDEVLEFGDEVLIVSTGRFRGRASGIDVTARAANHWTIRDGRLSRFCFYQSKEDALAELEAQASAARSAP
jgi:ketosteroid isomerase-like protein